MNKLKKIKCTHCGSEMVPGDVRSGLISFNAFFTPTYDLTSAQEEKVESGLVIAMACLDCGRIESFLEARLRAHG